MNIFKAGDKVRTIYEGIYHHGEITLIRERDGWCKVLFDGDSDLNYDYYAPNMLELVMEKNVKEISPEEMK